MKRTATALALAFAAAALLTGASVWEGAAVTAAAGELPESGYYVATNAFPRNTVVDVKNLENDKTIRAIVSGGLDAPGLLASLSRDAAGAIGLSSRDIGRVRMTMPADPIAFARFNEGFEPNGDPDHDPQAAIAAAAVPETPPPETPAEAAPPEVASSEEALPADIAESVQSAEETLAEETPVDLAEEMPVEEVPAESAPAAAAIVAPVEEGLAAEEAPAAEELAAEEPAAEEPAAEELTAEEPAVEEAPAAELAASPVAEESAVEEAIAAAPVPIEESAETPATEEVAEAEVPAAPGADVDVVLVPAEERPPQAETADLPAEAETAAIPEPVPTLPAESEVAAVETMPEAGRARANFGAPVISDLEKGKYYLQLGAFGKAEAVEAEIAKHGKSYPLAIQSAGSAERPIYRVLLGPVNLGESGALLQRFKRSGYKDAFVKQGS